MPEQVGKLLTIQGKTTSQDPPKPFYILEFKPKGAAAFKISTFHPDHKKLDELKWYSVAYEVDGQYKNVKNKVDISQVEEPAAPTAGATGDPAASTGGAATGNTSAYRQPIHPREQRSIHASIALERAVQLACAGVMRPENIPDQTRDFYDLLVELSSPPTNPQQNGATSTNAQAADGRPEQSPTDGQKTPVRGNQDVPTVEEWAEFWKTAGQNGYDAEQVDIILGRSFAKFRAIKGVTEEIGIKKIDDYVAMGSG